MSNNGHTKIKILFVIHDLSVGGAEKVLINLVNNMDKKKFDITVMALFGGGVNEQFLNKDIRLINCHKKPFRANSHLMKFFTPRQLYRNYIKEHYNIIVSYLEGPSARIVSGCDDFNTKLISWIHIEQKTKEQAAISFRSYEESLRCYSRFDRIICVSNTVKQDFIGIYPLKKPVEVLYNTNESMQILDLSEESVPEEIFSWKEIKLVGVGKIVPNKGFDRLARVHKRLKDDGYPIHTYILGIGPQQGEIEQFLQNNSLTDSFTFLGYQTNPYKYVAKCNLFICSSFAEGFSTATTEALIVGTPVCTVEVSGMKEMLGKNNEFGIIVENNEDALYLGIKKLMDNPELLNHYRKMSIRRGKDFSTEETVNAVQNMLIRLMEE